MGWSLPLFSLGSTIIRVHVTFFLLVAWIGGSYFSAGGWSAAVEGVLYLLAIFGCVLLHELGHVYAARRYGIRTPDVTLLPIGGVANLERIPEKPGQELVVALAGPAVNVAIAVLLFVSLDMAQEAQTIEAVDDPQISFAARLAVVNVLLVVFNMIPAFPMDGGRVLRALLSFRLGNRRATAIAAAIGQVLAVALGLWGVTSGNLLLVLVAIFIFLAARAEGQIAARRATPSSPTAGDRLLGVDAMITDFEAVGPAALIDTAADIVARTTQPVIPVIDADNRLAGMLTREETLRALRYEGKNHPVSRVMNTPVPVFGPTVSLKDILTVLKAIPHGAVGIIDESDGTLLGLVTRETARGALILAAGGQRGGSWSKANPWTGPR